MHLVQRLPDNPLDIVGDVHGEISALHALLLKLGYDAQGRHPQERKLVFIGDLVDRGPDSDGVVSLVQTLVQQGNAYCVLGNHEINLLIDDVKDGSGWFFDERHQADLRFYAPFTRTPPERRQALRDFLGGLPIALVRDDIRIVHAAWTRSAIDAISDLPIGSVTRHYQQWEAKAQLAAESSGLYQRYRQEKQHWYRQLEDEKNPPPFLTAIAEYEAMQQMVNPLKILTSGVEQRTDEPFFAGNRWRYSDRIGWWEDYDEAIPVVIGHYWRLLEPGHAQKIPRYSRLFSHIAPTAWHGRHRNVFCVDYSVGARWRDRRAQRPIEGSRFKLAALQWPENRLVFDSGEILPTVS